MAVLATKTEPKCKLCRHPNRAEIDALLEKRSKGETDDQGRRFNQEYVLEILATWGVKNPTAENIKNHWRKHCEVVSAETVEEQEQALDELKTQMLAILDESDGSVDGDLLATFRLGIARIRGRILRGEDPGVSLDHAMKAAAELSKRQHNEAGRELLGALVGGIGRALAEPRQPKQLDQPAEVIDVEVEAVE